MNLGGGGGIVGRFNGAYHCGMWFSSQIKLIFNIFYTQHQNRSN